MIYEEFKKRIRTACIHLKKKSNENSSNNFLTQHREKEGERKRVWSFISLDSIKGKSGGKDEDNSHSRTSSIERRKERGRFKIKI